MDTPADIETLRAALAIERERNKILMTQIAYARQALQLALNMLGTHPNADLPGITLSSTSHQDR